MARKTKQLGRGATVLAFLVATAVAVIAGSLCYWMVSKGFELRRLAFWDNSFGARRAIEVVAASLGGFILARMGFGFAVDERPGGSAVHTVIGLLIAVGALTGLYLTSPDLVTGPLHALLDFYGKAFG